MVVKFPIETQKLQIWIFTTRHINESR